MIGNFERWLQRLDKQAAEDAATGDNTRARVSSAFAAHYDAIEVAGEES